VTSSAADGVMYGVTNPYTLTTHTTSAGDNYYNYSAYGTVYGPAAYKIGSWTTTTFTSGDKISVAVDMDNGFIYFAKNDTWLMSSDPTTATGAGAAFSIGHESILWPIVNQYLSYGTNMQFDSSLWSYSAPTGYSALNQDALTSSDQFISAFSWIKNRDASDNHMLFDRVRGTTKDLHSNLMVPEATNVNTLQSFLAGGVQVGSDVEVNTANESYVLWNWMVENTGSGASNEDGSINTTATLVDTTLGMSISTFTGTGANATIGHGLGVVPKFVIIKNMGTGQSWQCYHKEVGNTKAFYLNLSNVADASSTYWQDTTPTSSVISIGSNAQCNQSSQPHVCYAFTDSQFISIGSWEGNASTDGPFIPTVNSLGVPIQPKWIIAKNYEQTYGWFTVDDQISSYNVRTHWLDAATTAVEGTTTICDFVTGGMKWRATGGWNNSGYTVIYMAIGTPIIDTDGRIIAGQ